MFKCAHCAFQSPKVDSLADHVKKKHEPTNKSTLTPSKVHQCKFCSYISANYSSVVQHSEAKHGYTSVDEIQDASKEKIQKNQCISQEGKNRILSCKICPFQTDDIDELETHLTSKHFKENKTKNQSFPAKPSSSNLQKGLCCATCEKVLPKLFLPEEHSPTTHLSENENNGNCFICEEPLSQSKPCSSTLEKNLVPPVETTSNNSYTTGIAQNTSKGTSQSSLTSAKKHIGPLRCKFCTFSTDDFPTLVEHTTVEHDSSKAAQNASKVHSKANPTGQSILACKFCSFTAATRLKLFQHIVLNHKNAMGQVDCTA